MPIGAGTYKAAACPNPFSVCFVKAEYHKKLNAIRLMDIIEVADVGTPINRLTVAGQLEGGIAQGVGYALYERMEINPRSRRTLSTDFLHYRIPQMGDMPRTYVDMVNSHDPYGPHGAKSVGELATVPVAPAIAQAASLTASPQIRNIATVGGSIMQDRRCIYFSQPHLWRSGLAYCFKTGGSICNQIPNSPVCRAIYYSDIATALIAYEAEVEYIEDGETHRTDLKSLIERHSVANGLACHEHLPILVTRFFIPAAEKGERSGFYKYAMRTTIDFPIINFALRCGGNRPARLAAGAVAPHPVVMAETAAKIDSDATDDEVIAQAEDELRKLTMPIKEACMTPAVKRSHYRHVAMLLDLRK